MRKNERGSPVPRTITVTHLKMNFNACEKTENITQTIIEIKKVLYQTTVISRKGKRHSTELNNQ